MSENQDQPAHTDLTAIHYTHRDRLPMWVIFDNARDYPGQVVARMFFTLPQPQPTNLVVVGVSIDAVRNELPSGLVCIPRSQSDQPQVVETWI